MAAKIRPFFVVWYFMAYSCSTSSLHDLGCWEVTSWLIPDLAESSSVVSWQFVSAPQTTPMTANRCGNIFVLLRAMIVTIDQNSFSGCKSYIPRTFLLLIKYRRVGSSIRSINILKQKEIHANFVIKQISKMWTPCLSAFYCVISRATFAKSFEHSSHSAFFEISSRAVKKL